ncbi:MAG: HD domain-containing protein [Candidatus Heimdallarchaeota archaeon]
MTKSTTNKMQFIKDPIHGYIFINDFERELIDTRFFQRLRRIKQLSGSEFVYPGANHTRFEHSLGVSYLAEKMAASLCNDEDVDITDHEKSLVKIAALLHDVGHGPFSHTFEALLQKVRKNHEDLTRWIIKESEIADILNENGLKVDQVCGLIHGNKTIKNKGFLNQIISSSCDVDKMDFIVRDSYHTGAEYGQVDVMRILYTMGVINDNLAVNYSALPALEAFLIARVESFRTIYFHKVSRASQLMIVRAMELAEKEIGLLSFKKPEDYLKLDDFSVWSQLMESKAARKIMTELADRKLLKVAFEREFMTRDDFIQSTLGKKEYREKLIEEIANEAKVSIDSIFIDIPTLPSVPYSHSIDLPAYEIPMFVREGTDRTKKEVKIRKVSRIFESLMGMMYIFRVYSYKEDREKVNKAAKKIFGQQAIEKQISF